MNANTIEGQILQALVQRSQQLMSLYPERLPKSGLPRTKNFLKAQQEQQPEGLSDLLPPFKLDRNSDSSDFTFVSHSQNITEISNEGEAQISQSEERLSGAEPAQARKLKLKARKQLKVLRQSQLKTSDYA